MRGNKPRERGCVAANQSFTSHCRRCFLVIGVPVQWFAAVCPWGTVVAWKTAEYGFVKREGRHNDDIQLHVANAKGEKFKKYVRRYGMQPGVRIKFDVDFEERNQRNLQRAFQRLVWACMPKWKSSCSSCSCDVSHVQCKRAREFARLAFYAHLLGTIATLYALCRVMSFCPRKLGVCVGCKPTGNRFAVQEIEWGHKHKVLRRRIEEDPLHLIGSWPQSKAKLRCTPSGWISQEMVDPPHLSGSRSRSARSGRRWPSEYQPTTSLRLTVLIESTRVLKGVPLPGGANGSRPAPGCSARS